MIIILAILVLFIIGLVLFNIFYDFTKISWDKESDINIDYMEPTTLELKVNAFDKKNNPIKDIEFKVKDGKIESSEDTVKWELPNEEGTYEIDAIAPSGKKISKKITVVSLEDKKLNGVLTIEEENLDSDFDGLNDEEEKKLGTNPYSPDTDFDGIPDKLEIEVTKTDPLQKDTDSDGLSDGDELDLGFSPLKKDSKGDGIKDGNRKLTYALNEENLGISMNITGQGNIASTTIDEIKNKTFSDMSGVLDTLYNFDTEGKIESAEVTIKYNLEELKNKNLDENNLTLYYFNETTKELENVPTTVDIENKTITATLKHFSKYIIGDSNLVLKNYKSQIMFVIDNSVSMYSKDQMTKAGYPKSTGAIGNDVTFKRLTLTNKLVDKFTGNYQFGLAEFSGDYVNITNFTDDKEKIKKSVNSLESKWKSNMTGTNIKDALINGINEFADDDFGHYIILLTDGKNNKGNLTSNKKKIISSANKKNIKICAIGLGNNIDERDLNEIAEKTGCDYYNATDASALDEIYALVGANINYNLVDTDYDDVVDGMIQADSGFIVKRDGFSFGNFRSNKSVNGHCYGMATFAMLYYRNELPMSLTAKDNSRFYLSQFKKINLESKGYDLSNTYFSENKPLYDFKITTPALRILLGYLPYDFHSQIENDTWLINEKYYESLKKIGAKFSIEDYHGILSDFTKYQDALLTIDSEPFNTGVSRDESQLINAIWRLFILQANSDSKSFSTSPDKIFNELYTELNNKNPIVITVGHKHAINALRLIQDINDANQFKIEVYDNNYPGSTKYIEVRRKKYSKFTLNYTAWTNKYSYSFRYDIYNGNFKDVSVQLDYVEIN